MVGLFIFLRDTIMSNGQNRNNPQKLVVQYVEETIIIPQSLKKNNSRRHIILIVLSL